MCRHYKQHNERLGQALEQHHRECEYMTATKDGEEVLEALKVSDQFLENMLYINQIIGEYERSQTEYIEIIGKCEKVNKALQESNAKLLEENIALRTSLEKYFENILELGTDAVVRKPFHALLNQDLQAKLDLHEKEHRQLEDSNRALRSQLEAKASELGSLKADHSKAADELRRARQDLDLVRSEKDRLQRELDDKRALLLREGQKLDKAEAERARSALMLEQLEKEKRFF